MFRKQIIEAIKKFEGFKASPYKCAGGYLTIGYGHLLKDDEFKYISEQEAEKLLLGDMKKAAAAINRLVHVQLEDSQFDALLSFIFNLGAGTFQRSTLRQKINRQEHELVPEELMKWIWAGGKKQSGLIKRRAVESGLYS